MIAGVRVRASHPRLLSGVADRLGRARCDAAADQSAAALLDMQDVLAPAGAIAAVPGGHGEVSQGS